MLRFLSIPDSLGFGSLAGASTSLLVLTPQNPVRIYPHQTAFLCVSLHFQQPEWKYFHAKWKFLTKNSPILYYECNISPGSAGHTCKRTVEKEEPYKERADIEEDGSLVLKDVQPEDAGKYEIHVLALDESATAEVELVVMQSNGGELSLSGRQPPEASSKPMGTKDARDDARCPAAVESGLPTETGNQRGRGHLGHF